MARNVPYDRTRILKEAVRAQGRRRRRKAIALYRQILAVEAGNAELHAKLAPLLAQTGQRFDAWQSFRAAARGYIREGLVNDALLIYRDAVRLLPTETDAWLSYAKLLRKESRNREALDVLHEGRRALRKRRWRPQAIYLLRYAREIETWDVKVVLDLARQLAGTRQREEAVSLLRHLATRTAGKELRQVLAAQFRLSPTLGHGWSWLRSALARGSSGQVRGPARAPRRSSAARP